MSTQTILIKPISTKCPYGDVQQAHDFDHRLDWPETLDVAKVPLWRIVTCRRCGMTVKVTF